MNKKRIIVAVLAILVCFGFSACGNTVEDTTTTTAESISTTIQEITEAAEETTVVEATSKKEATTKESTTKESTTKNTATTKKQESTKKATTTKKKVTTNSNNVKCTVTVQCKSILENMDDLKDGHQPFVPENGYIINGYNYSGTSENSVFDALEQACKNNKIKLTTEKTSFGIYISGINNLDEFDCGKQSGWMYSVNGKRPNTTCENVKIQNGDSIEFEYVCKY